MFLRKILASTVAMLILLAAQVPLRAEELHLDYGALSSALDKLAAGDRKTVNDAIELIKKGNHGLALERLEALNQSEPNNAALRILTAYALLQLGNFVGAFENAQTAEKVPGGNVYACWFLAKVALLTGKPEVCRREMGHLEKAGAPASQLRELREEMAAKQKSQSKN